MAVILSNTVLNEMDEDTQQAILDAQLADIKERREVKDGGLFTHCFYQVAQADNIQCAGMIEWFSDIAGKAFKLYHDLRKQGAMFLYGEVVYVNQPGTATGEAPDQQPDPDAETE
jgi:hypothetical protein